MAWPDCGDFGCNAGRDQSVLHRDVGAASFGSVVRASLASGLVGAGRTVARPWRGRPVAAGPAALVALGAGAAGGAATLAKPSFAPFLPGVIVAWLIIRVYSREWRKADLDRARSMRRFVIDGQAPSSRGEKNAARGGLLVLVGAALVMSPWWVRNARVYGRFVPTSVWFGESLYDGLNPGATGASDMRFREEPALRVLGEEEQDATLERRAFDFVRSDPFGILQLAAIKFGRYFSPWPNASLRFARRGRRS